MLAELEVTAVNGMLQVWPGVNTPAGPWKLAATRRRLLVTRFVLESKPICAWPPLLRIKSGEGVSTLPVFS